MELNYIISKVDQLKKEIEAVRPLSSELELRIMQKFRLDWNYHSNAIEGNSLTYGETRAFLMQGVTAKGKPFKDHLDIEGHEKAINYLEDFVKDEMDLSQKMIKELHKILLVRPYSSDTVTPDGIPAKRIIQVGQYKQSPNHVKTKTGKIHYYASPEETPAKMSDLITWYRKHQEELHPLILAATLHYEFVAIHPFDDGNGRMARLLMNLVLMNKGFVPAVLPKEKRDDKYFPTLEKADVGEMGDFIELIGEELIRSMELYLKGARGENIEELGDLDKKLALLERRMQIKQILNHHEKNDESFELMIRQFLIPFSSRLLDTLSKFDRFFEECTHSVTVTDHDGDFMTDYSSTTIEDAIRLKFTNLNSFFKQVNVKTFRLSFLWKNLINKNIDIWTYINFDLKKYFYDISFVTIEKTDINTIDYPDINLSRNHYDDDFNMKVCETIVSAIANSIFQQIEQKL